jgi:predicted permease
VAGQIALSLSLLVGAGLLVRSLLAIVTSPTGYQADGVVTFGVRLPTLTYTTPDARARFFEALEERLRAASGVVAVASASELPSPDMNRNSLEIDGKALPAPAGPTFVQYASVSDDYFRTLGIPLQQGRTFTRSDDPAAPPAIVIGESMARRFWPAGDALGARMRISPHTSERWGVVVGIVADVRTDPTREHAEPMAYGSNRQDLSRTARHFLIRSRQGRAALERAVSAQVSALDPSLPVHQFATLRELLDETVAPRRTPVVVMSAFGALALVLACVGVYAMFAAMVAAREREFGIRTAVGARSGSIVLLVLRGGIGWMAAGLAGGAVGCVLISRVVQGLLYAIAPLDPIVVTTAVLLLMACATTALLVPVRRAARVNPAIVLR